MWFANSVPRPSISLRQSRCSSQYLVVLDGAGIVQLPTMMIWRDLAAGTLVPVLPEWRPAAGMVHAVFPSRRGLLPSVRTLIDFLARECAVQRKAIDETIL
ncbi:LysR substrate-binding domain-containing protein [Brucella anthropi]|uniref:LysR substrate-binding domain-containing protein n=1 Tax=Brucella anthropi TaxID=529 RepID=UPI003EE1B1C5